MYSSASCVYSSGQSGSKQSSCHLSLGRISHDHSQLTLGQVLSEGAVVPEQQVHEEHSNVVIMYNATRWVGQGLCGSVQEA
jgi:hypothetical protein